MMEWKVRLLGTRGSAPITGERFQVYGGDTVCVALEGEKVIFVFDAGTGIMHLDPHGKEVHIFLSHYHQDHMIGLGKWSGLLDPTNKITLHLPDLIPGVKGVDVLRTFYQSPYWPIGLDQYPAKVSFDTVTSQMLISGIRIDSMKGCHPNGVQYYRVYVDDKSLTYMVDCELPEDASAFEAFAADTTILVIDGQMDESDMPMKRGWGHNTMLQSARFGEKCGAKKTVLVHVDVDVDDEQLLARSIRLKAQYSNSDFGKQGEELML